MVYKRRPGAEKSLRLGLGKPNLFFLTRLRAIVAVAVVA